LQNTRLNVTLSLTDVIVVLLTDFTSVNAGVGVGVHDGVGVNVAVAEPETNVLVIVYVGVLVNVSDAVGDVVNKPVFIVGEGVTVYVEQLSDKSTVDTADGWPFHANEALLCQRQV